MKISKCAVSLCCVREWRCRSDRPGAPERSIREQRVSDLLSLSSAVRGTTKSLLLTDWSPALWSRFLLGWPTRNLSQEQRTSLHYYRPNNTPAGLEVQQTDGISTERLLQAFRPTLEQQNKTRCSSFLLQHQHRGCSVRSSWLTDKRTGSSLQSMCAPDH